MINATAHGIAKHAEKSEDEFSHFFSLSHTTVIPLFRYSFIHSVLPGHLDYDLSSNVEIIFNTTSPQGGSQGSKHPKPGSLPPCPLLPPTGKPSSQWLAWEAVGTVSDAVYRHRPPGAQSRVGKGGERVWTDKQEVQDASPPRTHTRSESALEQGSHTWAHKPS